MKKSIIICLLTSMLFIGCRKTEVTDVFHAETTGMVTFYIEDPSLWMLIVDGQEVRYFSGVWWAPESNQCGDNEYFISLELEKGDHTVDGRRDNSAGPDVPITRIDVEPNTCTFYELAIE